MRARPIASSSTRAIKATGGLRICTAPGCKTKISMYNHADTCFLHTEPLAAGAPRSR